MKVRSPGEYLARCMNCGTNLPDTSRFCLTCGKEMILPAQDDSNVEAYSMILAGFSAMLLFFSFSFVLVAAVAEPGFWLVSLILFLIAVTLLLARYNIIRKHRNKVAEEKSQALARAKCKYCGGQNAETIQRCEFCGAPLW